MILKSNIKKDINVINNIYKVFILIIMSKINCREIKIIQIYLFFFFYNLLMIIKVFMIYHNKKYCNFE